MVRPVAVIDANVLYGIEVTDLLLTLATQRAIRVHWSDEILEEVRRNLATRPDLSDAAIEYRLMQVNRALPSALDSAPDELIDSMPINPKDRHVLALAFHMEAPFVISHNLRDFPDVMCAPFGVRALEPDDFLAALGPDHLHDAVIMMSQRRRRPPISTAQLLDRLNPALPLTVERVRPGGPVADEPYDEYLREIEEEALI